LAAKHPVWQSLPIPLHCKSYAQLNNVRVQQGLLELSAVHTLVE